MVKALCSRSKDMLAGMLFLLLLAPGCGGDKGGNPDQNGDDGEEQTEPPPEVTRLSEQDLSYLGAFRLPEEFNWGALGMCFYPPGDGGAGSLLVTGMATRPAEFGEVSIPAPQPSPDWQQLPAAELLAPLRGFADDLVRRDLGEWAEFTAASGIEYVPARGAQTRAKLYGTIDCWYCVGDETFPTVFMSELDGSNPRGLFHVGPRELPFHGNKSGDYLFTVPQWYADRHLGGRTLVTGKTRGASFGSMGPTLFAFRPWETEAPGGDLDAVAMLWYRLDWGCASPNVSDKSLCDYPGFTMGDKWEGGAFVESGGRCTVILDGRKGLGGNHYGEPRRDDCSLYKGYHSDPYERQVVFYDVEELGEVAAGRRQPWTVVPYRTWRPTELYNRDAAGHSCSEVGGMAYDRQGRRLFIIEKSLPAFNLDDQAVVHVWRVNGEAGR